MDGASGVLIKGSPNRFARKEGCEVEKELMRWRRSTAGMIDEDGRKQS